MRLTFNCFHHNVLHYSMISYNILQSKHLKGQDPPVSDGHVFGSKEVSWIPLLVTSRFWIKGGQLDPPVGDVTFFRSKEVSFDPASVT